MKRILVLLFLCYSYASFAQDRIDTLYYNKLGQIAQNKTFADYYRIALYPADSTRTKEFRDFYRSGELRKEGFFLHIDSLDDRKTIFNGDILSYFKNGHVSEKFHFANGLLHGEYLQYNDNGTLKTQYFYYEGKLSGICKTYNPDGSCQIIEYNSGLPIHDYYLLSDIRGNSLKFRIADNMPVWETPEINERYVNYWDGIPWEIYFKNGITLALTNSVIKDYGKWHCINLLISNNSPIPIDFTPETDIAAYSVNKQGVSSILYVWPCDAYIKKVDRAQTWAAVLMSVSEGMATANAGYSTSISTGYNSDGSSSTYMTTTYDASAAYLANSASQQRIEDFSQALQEEKEVKRIGYLKRNTIYPGESISGYVYVERIKGERVVFVINIKGAEYLYEWGFDKKSSFLLD